MIDETRRMANQDHPPPTNSEPQSFAALNHAHADLEELFLVHQECLLVGAFAEATALLTAYRDLVELHMKHEEGRVLPLFAKAKETRWPEELYTGQHKKILALLARIETAQQKLALSPGWRRRVIAVLETETTLKHLLEHHHLAEDQDLYPVTDQHATDEQRSTILAACAAEWAEAMSRHSEVLARARAKVSSGPQPLSVAAATAP